MNRHTIIIKRIEKPGRGPIFMRLHAYTMPNSTQLMSKWHRVSAIYVEAMMGSSQKVILVQPWDGTKAEFLA